MNDFAEPGELISLTGSYPTGPVVSPAQLEQYIELVSFARDIASGTYGRFTPLEIVRRAERVLKLTAEP